MQYGGVTVLWKYFIKKRYFLNDGFPYDHYDYYDYYFCMPRDRADEEGGLILAHSYDYQNN